MVIETQLDAREGFNPNKRMNLMIRIKNFPALSRHSVTK